MKFVRFGYKDNIKWGLVEGDRIREVEGSCFDHYKPGNKTYGMEEVRILAPVQPAKVVAVGLNYSDHAKEFGLDVPQTPVLFVKLPHTIIGPGEAVLIPKGAARVDFEAELAIVIKKSCRKVEAHDADGYILGATCLNDVTDRDVQKSDGQWIRAKNFETFCPIGPYIVDDVDYNALDIKLLLNGEEKQHSNTSNLIWNVQQLVSFVSHHIPLNAGDMITTGTPSGVGPMKEGDIVEVVIEGVGTLRNLVKNAE